MSDWLSDYERRVESLFRGDAGERVEAGSDAQARALDLLSRATLYAVGASMSLRRGGPASAALGVEHARALAAEAEALAPLGSLGAHDAEGRAVTGLRPLVLAQIAEVEKALAAWAGRQEHPLVWREEGEG